MRCEIDSGEKIGKRDIAGLLRDGNLRAGERVRLSNGKIFGRGKKGAAAKSIPTTRLSELVLCFEREEIGKRDFCGAEEGEETSFSSRRNLRRFRRKEEEEEDRQICPI